jgi:hypothetical protein
MAGMDDAKEIDCADHGKAVMTFVCGHLAEDPQQTWYSLAPDSENQWPDDWCSGCHISYLRENEWNEKNEDGLNVKLLCHHCYEAQRASGQSVYVG